MLRQYSFRSDLTRECVEFCSEYVQSSLFLGGKQKVMLNFLPPQLQNEMGTVLEESNPLLYVQNVFFGSPLNYGQIRKVSLSVV